MVFLFVNYKLMLKFTRVLKYYSDPDYCCPKCGTPDSECTPTEWYTYICPKCEEEFETVDT